MFDDDEAVEAMLDADIEPPRERMSEWSPEHRRLTEIADLIDQHIRATVAAAGGKPAGRFKPRARPMTALTRARHRRSMRELEELQQAWAPAPEPDGG